MLGQPYKLIIYLKGNNEALVYFFEKVGDAIEKINPMKFTEIINFEIIYNRKGFDVKGYAIK